jgi:NAD(P) transhydrogenase
VTNPITPTYDVLVIGGGPGGERAAIQAAKAGKRAALVERAHVVGGAAINWGTIPSKTLRESALFVHGLMRHRLHGVEAELTDEVSVADFMYRERLVVQRELELINTSLGRYRVEVFRGHGRFIEPHAVEVLGKDGRRKATLRGEVIVVATGSSPNRPADVPFDGDVVFDSDSILKLPRMPRTMIVLGAGVIGVEYASIFAALGVYVTLVDTRSLLLPYLDREIVSILERALSGLHVDLSHDDRHERIERLDGSPARVRCRTKKGRDLVADVLLYCVGRDGNTRDLGLEAIGLTPDKYGLLKVNGDLQTDHPHIYAVGDVIGYPALASTAMEQGRRAVRHALGILPRRRRREALPFAIYSIPEVSYVGETEESLKEKGRAYVVGRGHYAMNPRGQIIGDTDGVLKLLFDAEGGRLLGAHIVGDSASELVHIGQAYLNMEATAFDIAESLFNYPTLSDLYRHAAMTAAADLTARGVKESG